ncbi:MAG: RagB/SusD domain-containing protein [Flavobacteriaceae bacterium FS1-H7996/R]|nr:MAG: RagB/SusD domain-containing protein [Flavobacteriaceae bacterium FS1-H7996/R]
MKKTYIKLMFAVLLATSVSCEKEFLDLVEQDKLSEELYFKTPDHFRNYSNDFYNGLWGWSWDVKIDETTRIRGNAQQLLLDRGSDLNGYGTGHGVGDIIPNTTDDVWALSYIYIRETNILLEKAEAYSGTQEEIAEYVSTAKFFRAYHYFFMLKRFGGVPLITKVLDVDSPELYGTRNSRYEVFALIKEDLEAAIDGLPRESSISSAEKGHISKEAAQSLLAKALLFEATWEKYVGTSTDGDGTSFGAGTSMPSGYPSTNQMFQQVVDLSKDVMDNGGFELWNYNEELNNLTMYYLFNLEDGESNPAGLDKATNKEFIFYAKYDFNLKKGNTNISHASYYSSVNQKFTDMFLCTDGLPVDKSPLFQGYQSNYEQFYNRDYRLYAYTGGNEQEVEIVEGTVPLLGGGVYYGNRKFRSFDYPNYREANQESADFPYIRLSEVYLMYAEGLYELNGTITDSQLNESLNKVRERSGVAALTNAMASTYGLDILEEIRRERAVELYLEDNRFNDLRRWGIAEQELGASTYGQIIEGTDYENNPDLYDPSSYQYGEETVETGVGPRKAIVLIPSANKSWSRTKYLFPIPLGQVNLNKNLLQNPGY